MESNLEILELIRLALERAKQTNTQVVVRHQLRVSSFSAELKIEEIELRPKETT
jgi:hypothetical protein